MHMWDVGTDGQMDGDWDTLPIGRHQNAGRRVGGRSDATGEKFAGSFAITDVRTRRVFGNFIELLASLGSHPKSTCVDPRVDVLGRHAGDCNLKIMDQSGTVHGNTGYETSLDEIDQNGAQADLDDVTANTPENRPLAYSGALDGGQQLVQIFRRQEFRKRIEKAQQRTVCGGRFSE